MSSLRLALKASMQDAAPNATQEKAARDKERKQKKERRATDADIHDISHKGVPKTARASSSPISNAKQQSSADTPTKRPPLKASSSQHVKSPSRDVRSTESPPRVPREPLSDDRSLDSSPQSREFEAHAKKRRRSDTDEGEKAVQHAPPSATTINQQPLIDHTAEMKPSADEVEPTSNYASSSTTAVVAESHPISQPMEVVNSAPPAPKAAPAPLKIHIPVDVPESMQGYPSGTDQDKSAAEHEFDNDTSEREAHDDDDTVSEKAADSPREENNDEDEDEDEDDDGDEEEEEEDEAEADHEDDNERRKARNKSRSIVEPRTPSTRPRIPKRGPATGSRRSRQAADDDTPRHRSSRNAAMVAKTKLTTKTPRGSDANETEVGAIDARRSGKPPLAHLPTKTTVKTDAKSEETPKHAPPVVTPVKEEEKWVQCDRCTKWRRLPGFVDVDALPEQWYCSMNQWDPLRNTCSAAEETYQEPKSEIAGDQKMGLLTQLTDDSANTNRGRISARAQKRKRPNRLRDSDDDNEHDADEPSDRHAREPKRRGLPTPHHTMEFVTVPTAPPAVVEKVNWVQCNRCTKWRKVPSVIDVEKFPNDWYCSMNTWALHMASCDAPEEGEEPQLVAIPARGQRSRRIRQETIDSANKKEIRHWVQCERRGCKKWRRLPVGMTPEQLPEKWYCEMNTWDLDVADCDAPEDLETRSDGAELGGLGRSFFPLRSKAAGTLSYRRLIFGPDGRVRPVFADRNRNNYGLFSFVETHRQVGSEDYIEPTRRIGYWWCDAFDNSHIVPPPSDKSSRDQPNSRQVKGRKRSKKGGRSTRSANKAKQDEDDEEDEDEDNDIDNGGDNDNDNEGDSAENEGAVDGEKKTANASADATQEAAGRTKDDSNQKASASQQGQASKTDSVQQAKEPTQDQIRHTTTDLLSGARRAAGWSSAPACAIHKQASICSALPLLQRQEIERGIVSIMINLAGVEGKCEAKLLQELHKITFCKPEVEACKKMLSIDAVRSYVRELELSGLAEVVYDNSGSLLLRKLKTPVCDELGFDHEQFPDQFRGPLKLRKPWNVHRQEEKQA